MSHLKSVNCLQLRLFLFSGSYHIFMMNTVFSDQFPSFTMNALPYDQTTLIFISEFLSCFMHKNLFLTLIHIDSMQLS